MIDKKNIMIFAMSVSNHRPFSFTRASACTIVAIMKNQYVLAALAMSVGAICTPADAKPVSAEDIYTAMQQPAKVEEVDLAKRQAALPALGYLPAGTDAYVAVAHVGQHISRALADEMLLDQPVEAAPPELVALESMALTMSEGSASAMRLLIPMLAGEQNMDIEDWIAEANPGDAEQMRAVLDQALRGQHQKAMDAFQQQWQMKPIYAVVTVKKGQEKMVEEWSKMIVSIILATHANTATPVQHGEFIGVKIAHPMGPHAALRECCVMTKHSGTALVVAICAKPEDISLPGSVEESALASPRLSSCDAGTDDLFMVSYGSADFAKTVQEAGFSGIVRDAEVVRLIFESLGAADASRKEAFDKAAAGVGVLMAQVNAIGGAEIKQESVMLCRLNAQEFTMEYSEDAAEASYEPGSLRFVSQVADAANIFYCESTPYRAKAAGAAVGQILPALLDVGKGYALTLREEKKEEAELQLKLVEQLVPELTQLGQALSTVNAGLGQGGAVLMDSAGSLPALFGGTKGNRVAMPRLAYCRPVTNRANLTRGWNEILGAMGGIAGKLFGSPMLVQALAFPSKQVGDAISYSLYMPICTEHMIPNVTVSDKFFVAGTSSAYNEKLVSAGTGSTPFCGSVFSLNPESLASTLRGIADAYRARIPAEEEAVPMAQVGDDDAAPPAAAEHKPTSQLEDVSETLEELATMAELAASVAESVHGTITIDNGRRTLRTTVRLQK